MKLLTYLEEQKAANGLTLTAMAKRVQVSVGHLHDIKHGRRLPSLAVAHRIAEATNGQVTPNDFHQMSPCERPQELAA